MEASISDFVALGILIMFIGFVAYCMAPSAWQSALGFTLICTIAVPVGLVAIVALTKPQYLIPATFIIGCLCVPWRRL